jgi:hypothetical protein
MVVDINDKFFNKLLQHHKKGNFKSNPDLENSPNDFILNYMIFGNMKETVIFVSQKETLDISNIKENYVKNKISEL